MIYDVAIVGGGPAGSTCAAFCAAKGLRVVVIEREKFPREKVCGDCLNPSAWPVLRRLKVEERIRQLPHAVLERVEFVGLSGQLIRVELPCDGSAEIAVKRSVLDLLLLNRAAELGDAPVRAKP
jgi:flavin-dependent dehydrogenase